MLIVTNGNASIDLSINNNLYALLNIMSITQYMQYVNARLQNAAKQHSVPNIKCRAVGIGSLPICEKHKRGLKWDWSK